MIRPSSYVEPTRVAPEPGSEVMPKDDAADDVVRLKVTGVVLADRSAGLPDDAGVQPSTSITCKSVADTVPGSPGPPEPKASPKVLSQSARSKPSKAPV